MKYRVLLLFLSALWADAQGTRPDAVRFSSNGARVSIHTESSAGRSPLTTSGVVTVEKDSSSYRIVLDKDNSPLFVYELELRKSGNNVVTLAIKPVSQERLQTLDFVRGKIRKNVPTISAAREFPPMRANDEVHIDILYNPRTGEKLWDVVRATPEVQPPAPVGNSLPGPRFSWEEVRVVMDGRVLRECTGTWMLGRLMVLRVPGQGRYYLVLHPLPEYSFEPNGKVNRKYLRIDGYGHVIEIVGESFLLTHSATGTVWTYHEPEAANEKPASTLEITSTDDYGVLTKLKRQ